MVRTGGGFRETKPKPPPSRLLCVGLSSVARVSVASRLKLPSYLSGAAECVPRRRLEAVGGGAVWWFRW